MAEPTIKMVWAIAKSPELGLSDDDLHAVVYGQTGKDSIRKLTRRELGIVIGALQKMKDSACGNKRKSKMSRGNSGTENQRKKIYKLTQELGWDNEARVNGLCKKMFGISSVNWLNYSQCSKLIEALKSMVARMDVSE